MPSQTRKKLEEDAQLLINTRTIIIILIKNVNFMPTRKHNKINLTNMLKGRH